MSTSDRLLQAVAVLLGAFGAFMILGAMVEIFDKTAKESVPSALALLILAGILPVVVAFWLFIRTRASASRRALEAREKTVLELAIKHQGVLTVPQVAQESSMTVEQARETLDRLNRKDYVEVAASESGTLVYKFPV